MTSALDEELSRAVKEVSPPSELLERLLALEVGDLTERRIERRIRDSKLPERKLLADFDFVFQKGVDKRQIMELATLDFAIRKQGVIIAGTSGAGKSHIAKALLLIGCQKIFRCRYVTATTMLRELLASLADNTLVPCNIISFVFIKSMIHWRQLNEGGRHVAKISSNTDQGGTQRT